MTELSLPTYENLLMEAISSLVVDGGTVTTAVAVGGNSLTDGTKAWQNGVHTNRMIKILKGYGAGQTAFIAANSRDSLIIRGSWLKAIAAGDTYAIINADLMQVLRDVFGGSANISPANPLAVNIAAALAAIDVSSRAGRLLGIVQSLTEWGGVALTGRDISLDLARIDVALSTRATESTIAKLIPVAKASLFNQALPAAEATWLGADIAPTNSPSYLRLYVSVAAAGILRVARTIGAATVVEDLNHGVPLAANSAYLFSGIEWRAGDSLNFRYSATGANILVFRADEIGGAE